MSTELEGFLLSPKADVVESAPRVYESEEVQRARIQDRDGRRIRVLIVVKTAPQPSQKYRDTVCVAGIALDPLRWVRLYPIPFRYLDHDLQFKKYSIVEVKVLKSSNDKRIESLKVDASSLKTLEELSTEDGWRRRAELIEPIGRTTLCELRRSVDADLNAPSLGLVQVERDSFSLTIKKHPGWNSRQKRVLEEQAYQETLSGELPPVIEAPRFRVHADFTCAGASGCSGHRIQLLDWELVALQRRYRDVADDEVMDMIQANFARNPTSPSKHLSIFVGNQADPAKRRAFEALGLYYPAASSVEREASRLF